MKRKNNLIKFIAVLVCLLCLASGAVAQRRKTSTRKTTRPAPSAAVNSNAEIKAAAAKVSIQVKNLTKFIFVLGGVAKDLEAIDTDIRSGRITRSSTIDQNTKNKQAVVTTIRNLRAGLVALEIDFRAKPALRNYVFQIGGISDAAGTAEEQAQAGQFTESGKTLLRIVEKLSDGLVAMP